MLNTNNTVNYEINVKRKEKKYSWSTVFAWLYLKTVGRILPKKWNKWAENILSNKVTFQDTTMQTECIETTDKNSDQARQVEDLQSKNGLLEVKIEELRSIIIRLKADLQSKNSSLKKENRELRSIIERLKKDYRELVEVTDKQEKEFLVKLKAKSEMIECQGRELTELRAEFTDKINELLERVGEVRKNSLIKQSQKEQKQVVDQSKADIKKLQEEKENIEKQLKIMQQQLLNHQEQRKLEEKLKGVDKRLEDIDGETKEQTEAKAPDTVSTVSTAKSTTGSMKSTQSNVSKVFSKLFGDKNLNNFLSRKNEELKKGFPEFKEKHFCHNMLNETIKSLSNQDDGKFESSKLLELLESNLKQSARGIIEAKVKEVVNKHCNIGKNVGKELRDGTLKAKLSPSVRKCVKKLEFNKQEEGVNKIVDSILHSFNSKNNNNNDSGELLKEIVVKELVEARMRFFSDKIQELQLTPSIRDKFLSPDQKMCSQIPGKENMYELSTNKVSRPHSSMSSGVLNKLCQTAFLVRLNFQSARKENIKLRDS
ncbi:coiled-coil domain-containing protein [Wolbachia endosymbiont (group A) of Barypeithes pellucidus]|uniref:coiled-coil domain-containing protein n=1 Tax=Wolbachia endosymbiont (group A) of Barypeithes pellucidus TaxID=3139322 RepID=UPI003CCB491C